MFSIIKYLKKTLLGAVSSDVTFNCFTHLLVHITRFDSNELKYIASLLDTKMPLSCKECILSTKDKKKCTRDKKYVHSERNDML